MINCQKSGEQVGVCLESLYFYPLYSGAALRFRYAPGLAERGVRMRVFTQAGTTQNVGREGLIVNRGESHGALNSVIIGVKL